MKRLSSSVQSRWLPAILLVVLIAVFATFYMVAVQPQRETAREKQQQLEQLTADLDRQRSSRQVAFVNDASSTDRSNVRPANDDSGSGAVESIAALLTSPPVDAATNFSIQVGFVREGAPETRTPVSVTFDARYEQIARFLRGLPQQFELDSLEVIPQRSPQVHASLVLFTVQRKAKPKPAPTVRPAQPRPTTQRRRDAVAVPQPIPVVNGILFSNNRRVARIDGRVVAPGDHVGSAIVRSIEADAVIIVTPSGEIRRLNLSRPGIGDR
jgi:hypothetical protein